MLTRVNPIDVATAGVELTHLVSAPGKHGLEAVSAVWSATSEHDVA